jgi:hypothetical protein
VDHFDFDSWFDSLLDDKLCLDGARGLIYRIERRLVHLAAKAAREGRHDDAYAHEQDALILRHTRLSR